MVCKLHEETVYTAIGTREIRSGVHNQFQRG